MTHSRYIAWGDSAVGNLKQLNKLTGQSHPIIAVLDDFRMGPLSDADQLSPTLRTDWWKAVWSAQWWYNKEEYEAELVAYFAESQHHLLSALATPEPITIWIGNNAHDRLMLAMIASLTPEQTPLSIVDVTGHVPYHHEGQYAVAMCPPESLIPLTPRPLSDTERTELGQLWADWKSKGLGWREIDADGRIVDYPLDHLDAVLLAKTAELSPHSSSRVVGEIMGQHPGMVPDSFLFWRLELLRQAGRVVFTPRQGPAPQAPTVTLA